MLYLDLMFSLYICLISHATTYILVYVTYLLSTKWRPRSLWCRSDVVVVGLYRVLSYRTLSQFGEKNKHTMMVISVGRHARLDDTIRYNFRRRESERGRSEYYALEIRTRTATVSAVQYSTIHCSPVISSSSSLAW